MKNSTEAATSPKSKRNPTKDWNRSQRRSANATPGNSLTGSTAKDLTEEPFIGEALHGNEADSKAFQQASSQRQHVHFEVTLSSARKVCIAGSFNDWQPEKSELTRLDSHKWSTDLMLLPGTYEYRLVVDGTWMPDTNASRSVPNPFGEPNSLLIVSPSASA